MSIRPIDLNGMIQNTHEVSAMKNHDDQKPVIQQQNIEVMFSQETQEAGEKVRQADESAKEDFRYDDREGDGTGYSAGKRGKKKNQKKKRPADGQVFVKNAPGGFDIKI